MTTDENNAKKYADELSQLGGLPPKDRREDRWVDPEPQVERSEQEQPIEDAIDDELNESEEDRDGDWLTVSLDDSVLREIESRFHTLEHSIDQLRGFDDDESPMPPDTAHMKVRLPAQSVRVSTEDVEGFLRTLGELGVRVEEVSLSKKQLDSYNWS